MASDLTTNSRTCEVCSTTYTQKRSWQRFCSTKCRNHYHNNFATEKDMWKVHKVEITETEKKVLALIRDKECKTVYEMSQHVYLMRSNLYRVLSSLEYKGYIKKLPTRPQSWEFILGAK